MVTDFVTIANNKILSFFWPNELFAFQYSHCNASNWIYRLKQGVAPLRRKQFYTSRNRSAFLYRRIEQNLVRPLAMNDGPNVAVQNRYQFIQIANVVKVIG